MKVPEARLESLQEVEGAEVMMERWRGKGVKHKSLVSRRTTLRNADASSNGLGRVGRKYGGID